MKKVAGNLLLLMKGTDAVRWIDPITLTRNIRLKVALYFPNHLSISNKLVFHVLYWVN